METVDQTLLDQIVAQVLRELRPVAPVQPHAEPSPTHEGGLWLSETVITGGLLEEKLNGAKRLRIGERAILTPSARDLLRTRNIEWGRNGKAHTGTSNPRAKWSLIAQTITPAVQTLLAEWKRTNADHWRTELVGQPREAVELGIGTICKAESDGVAVLTDRAELIACEVNRNERIRAAVAADVAAVERVRESMAANLICINPTGKSFIELRNILKRFQEPGRVAPASRAGTARL